MLGGLLLVAIVAVVALASRAALYQAGARTRSLTWGLTAAVLVVVPTTLSRLTGDLFVAGLITGALAAAALVLLWRRGPQQRPPQEAQDRLPLWCLGLAALATAAVIWAAFGSYFWDEHSCHFGLVGVLSRGMVPPEHPLFPGEPIRYHYGFDVLAAQVRAFTGLGVAAAIDVATVLCFLLLLAGARDAGHQLGGRRAAALAVLLVPLGSGALQYLLFGDMGTIELHWDALPQAWRHSMPPPVISNFFQHPQGLGMALGLAVLLLFTPDEEAALSGPRLALGGFVLAALSLAQIVFFALLGLALGAAALFGLSRHRQVGRLLRELGVLAGAAVLAVGLGGFFADGAASESMLRFGQSLFPDPVGARVLRYLVLFGLPLLALPFATVRGWRRRSRARVALLVAAWVGLLLPNVITYARSWDIVKFLGVGMFFAHLLFADLLGTWWDRAPRRRALAAAVALLVSTSTAWLWLARSSVLDGRLGVPKMHFPGPSPLHEAVGAHLSPLVDLMEPVYVTEPGFGHATGLLTPGFDWRRVGQGFMLDRETADRLLTHKREAKRSLRDADLDALGVRYLVLSPGDVRALHPEGKASFADRTRFEHAFDVKTPHGVRHVWRRLTAP